MMGGERDSEREGKMATEHDAPVYKQGIMRQEVVHAAVVELAALVAQPPHHPPHHH